MILKYYLTLCVIMAIFFPGLFPASLKAQTPPIDLTELSIEDLLDIHINRQRDRITIKDWADRWSIGYHYTRVEFDEYLDGTGHESKEKIQNRFDIAPDKIVQEMHMTDITYKASDNLNISMLVPYIQQRTDHISIIPGYSRFSIRSSGIGDITLTASYLFKLKDNHIFMPHFGMSLPSGSIDEKGDTPSPGARNQLPYTMQLGSGTLDPIFGISYKGHSGDVSWGTGFQSKIHVGRNKRDYSLGDSLLLTAWIRSKFLFEWLEPSLKLAAHISSAIDGCDSDLPEPGRVPVTTPRYFGGEKVMVVPGLRFKVQEGMLKGHTIDVEGGVPVYQSTNGPFPSEEWRIGVGFNLDF